MYVTANNRAPELWLAEAKNISKLLGPAVDVWSFGCVLYEVAVGKVLMRPMRSHKSQSESQSCHANIKAWSMGQALAILAANS